MTVSARVQRIGRSAALIAGPAGAAAMFALLGSTSLTQPACVTAGLAVWMAIWWIFEAVPLAATSLLPIIVLPLTGVMSTRDAAAPFAHEIIFLFLGGFILGLSLEKWGAHRRIALSIINIVGFGPRQIVAGFMIASALLSMFISNTATVIMLLPIGASVISLIQQDLCDAADEDCGKNFAVALLLGIAYASSIGGIATINGTPPNGILVAFLRDSQDITIEYGRWMKFGLPLALVMLPIAWFVLVYIVFPVRVPASSSIGRHMRSAMDELGPISRAERTVFIIFALTAAAWIFKAPIIRLTGLDGLTDTHIALIGALALFITPVGGAKRAMDWQTAQRLPWGVLLLFGGGLSLAGAVQHTGLDTAIGAGIGVIGQPPTLVTLLVVATVVVFLTELTSNTAVTSALLPVLAAAAVGLGVSPLLICVTAAAAASYAFMLPVGTPPNAIVFGTGSVKIAQMAKVGLILNLTSIVLLVAGVAILGTMVFADLL